MSNGLRNEMLRNVVRTLVINGYTIESFDQPSHDVWIIPVRKRDNLGGLSKALLLFAPDVSPALAQRVASDAERSGAVCIHITTTCQKTTKFEHCYTTSEFFALLGGEVRVDRIFRPDLRDVLNELGHNRLPSCFVGSADDLLEEYSKECLQFLLECPVRRYGQERRFEKRPDGLALGHRESNFFFDSKAYGDRFHPSADDVRRFATYISDFDTAYGAFVGRISSFIVISGSFSEDRDAILEKSNELLALCQTPLSCITAANLAEMVQLTSSAGRARGAINWNRVFVPGLVDLRRLESELTKVEKDQILGK